MAKKITKKSKVSSKPKTKKSKELHLTEYSLVINGEKDVEYVELECDFSDGLYRRLLQHARENIFRDEQALVNWAFIDLLSNVKLLAECLDADK